MGNHMTDGGIPIICQNRPWKSNSLRVDAATFAASSVTTIPSQVTEVSGNLVSEDEFPEDESSEDESSKDDVCHAGVVAISQKPVSKKGLTDSSTRVVCLLCMNTAYCSEVSTYSTSTVEILPNAGAFFRKATANTDGSVRIRGQ